MNKNMKENIDQNLFNEKSLHLLNIRDLRDMGRKFGVPSPTTMKKHELVDYILKIVYGEVEIPLRNTCGRPSVREFDMDKCISKIKHTTTSNDAFKYSLERDYGTSMASSNSEQYTQPAEIKIRTYLTEGDDCYLRVKQFLSSPNDIKISKKIADKLKLENFDVLEIEEFDDLFKIITINGIKVQNKFENLECCGSQVTRGNTQNFYLRTKEEVIAEITELEKYCTENNIKIIIFSTNNYSGKNTECVTYSNKEDYSAIYKKFMNFSGLCEEALYNSEDVLIVVENIDDVEKLIFAFDNDISVRIKKHFQNLTTKVVTLGNAFVSFKLENEITY